MPHDETISADSAASSLVNSSLAVWNRYGSSEPAQVCDTSPRLLMATTEWHVMDPNYSPH